MSYRRGGPGTYPDQYDYPPATALHKGLMPRLGAATATLGGWTITGGGGPGSTINLAGATTSTAGAQSAADKTKLDALAVPQVLLAYTASTDLANGLAVAATTQTDIVPNQSFTVSSPASRQILAVQLGLLAVVGAGANIEGQVRAILDSGGTPVTIPLAIFAGNLSTNVAVNGGAALIGGLAAGAHTIKLAIYSSAALTAYCRANTQPSYEFARIQIVELNP